MTHPAKKFGSTACGAALALAVTAPMAPAQTPLPATAPTAITPSQLPSANPPASRAQATTQWDGHLLQISAQGENLGQVLAEISSRAGIHMVGYAPEDRIYGSYGPAPLVDVLSDLVNGLPVNMLFVERSGSKPAELTFTARNGSVTPPSPSPPQQFAQQQQQPPPPQNVPPSQPPNASANGPGPAGATGGSGVPAAATQSGDTGSNPASPNGVRTPQEIFEQLQRLRANAGAQKQ